MNRDYTDGQSDNITFFFGREIEHTPAYGMPTLFVVGVQPLELIREKLAVTTYDTKHIFFGANHSFKPGLNFPQDADQWKEWDNMIMPFLEDGYLCSLDIPITHAEAFLEGPLVEQNNFIPQIRIPLPYIKLWNYNTMIKLDDKDFNATNPGVWSHNLHRLMDRDVFTDWNQYKNDKVL